MTKLTIRQAERVHIPMSAKVKLEGDGEEDEERFLPPARNDCFVPRARIGSVSRGRLDVVKTELLHKAGRREAVQKEDVARDRHLPGGALGSVGRA